MCQGEEVILTNSSLDGSLYAWDFCPGDLDSLGQASFLSQDDDLKFAFNLTLVQEDNLWYGFLPNFSTGSLLRLNYGSEIESDPVIEDLGNINSLFNGAWDIQLYEESGSWYGLVINRTGANLLRLDFGSDLSNTPTGVDLGSLGVLTEPFKLTVENDGSGPVGLIWDGASGDVITLDFGGSIVNTPTTTSYTLAVGDIRDLSLQKVCNEWYGLAVNVNANLVYHLDYGANLLSTPTLNTLTISDITITLPSNVSFLEDGGNYYGMVKSRSGDLYRLAFDNINDLSPTGSNLGGYGVLSGSSFTFEMVRDSSSFIGYSTDFSSGNLYRISFSEDCDSSVSYSEEFEPSGVSYVDPGNETIRLEVLDSDGHSSVSAETLNVSTTTVPDIDLLVTNSCITSAIEFSGINNSSGQTILSWDWDFGDGNNSSGQQVSHTYASTGTYEVALTVSSDAGCNVTVTEEITVYPEPPMPSFTIPGTEFCTNENIVFTNITDETGYDDALEYEWDFNGEGSSTEREPSFAFTTAGMKTVTLTSRIPDCEENTFQIITLVTGPTVEFSYTNNCLNEQVAFSSDISGSFTSILWDFGDGNTSTDENPFHQYPAITDTYTVSLQVTNAIGCMTVFEDDLIVNADPLATFDAVNTQAREVTSITGQDQTTSGDNVINWDWIIDGSNYNGETVDIVFETDGLKTVNLTVTTAQGCIDVVMGNIDITPVECPTSSFIASTTICQGEEVVLTNSSLDGNLFSWDFCPGDLDSLGQASFITQDDNFLSTFHFTLIQQNNLWYGFLPNFSTGSLFRLSYGLEVESDPVIEDLGNIDGLFNGAWDIQFYEESSSWYGFVINRTGGNLIRLDFGSDLSNTPTGVDLGDLGLISEPYKLSIEKASSGPVGLIWDGTTGDVITLDFGGNVLNTPTTTSYTLAASDIRDLSIQKICNEWYGLAVSVNTNMVYRLDYGSSLLSIPSLNTLTISEIAIDLPSNVSFLEDGGNYYGMVKSRSGDLYRLAFDNIMDNSPEGSNLGNYGVLSSSSFTFEMVRDSSSFIGYSTDFITGNLYRISFVENCKATLSYSEEFEPNGIVYNISGMETIRLEVLDANGHRSVSTETLNVSTTAVPDIDILVTNACISSSIGFSGVNNTSGQSVLSWDWNFGDGNNASGQLATNTYLATGTYDVALTILSDAGCNTTVTKELTIYPEPPIPTFTVDSGPYCNNSQISFTNTTDETGYDDVLSYEWDFNSEGNATSENPDFTFTTFGTKDITLTSMLPGCETISSVFQIDVLEGPTSNFTGSQPGICAEDFISFTDISTNNPVSWLWDFDDGFTSTAQNPDHLFTDAGTYNVILTVTDAAGCQSMSSQEFGVSANPVVAFDFDVPCTSSTGIQFNDLSSVDGGNIVSREWFIGDQPLAEAEDDPNPLIQFGETGTINVRLEVLGSNGCEASYNEDLVILPSPQPEFSMAIGCQGEVSSFTDMTDDTGNETISWLWTLDGTTYTTQDIDHTFSGFGFFDVTLEVTGQNFCSETRTQSIEVLELPTPEFSVAGECSNDHIVLTDITTELQDPIVSRSWYLQGVPVGNGSEFILEPLPDNTYDIQLEVTTASGCTVSDVQTIVIDVAPEAEVDFPKNFGIQGESITFTNTSTGGTSFHWLFNGDSVSDNQASETFTFTELGVNQVALVASNDFGCNDTIPIDVLIAVPVVDLSIGQFEILENENKGTIFFEILNNSNLPINDTEVVIELENQISVTQQITELIGVGESELVSINLGIQLDQTEQVCITINSQYQGFEDVNPLDNEKCLAIEPSLKVEAPYPNPVTTEARVKLVTPSAGSLTVTLLNASGKPEAEFSYAAQEGLNNLFIDMKDLNAGVYFVRLVINGTTSVQRIVKL